MSDGSNKGEPERVPLEETGDEKIAGEAVMLMSNKESNDPQNTEAEETDNNNVQIPIAEEEMKEEPKVERENDADATEDDEMYRLATPICYAHMSHFILIPRTTSTSSSTLLLAKFISGAGGRRRTTSTTTLTTTTNDFHLRRRCSKDSDASLSVEEGEKLSESDTVPTPLSDTSSSPLDKDLKKVVQKTASTFAPRASTASKNPAVPGSTLYKIFEVQAYASMVIGGALSFNLIFPSTEPDLWRLMGMWSIWMFTIPSLRARDCSKKEKEALNYLFLLVPLLNVLIPFFIKSFAVVWSADTAAFLAMYAWKLGLLQKEEEA